MASLWISDDQPRQWTRNEVSLLETIAERTWIAIEKMRVDRALRDSEERLRVTLNTTVVGFATLTPETYFVDVNDAFCRIVGYTRQELLKMNFDLLTHPNFIEETRNHIAQLLAGDMPFFTLEKIYVRGDGTEIWVQNSVSIVRDENGDPLHLITICQDITERKQAEAALHQLNLELEERVKRRTIELQVANEFLRESEATSRLILESMPDAIVIIDKEGRLSMPIRRWKPCSAIRRSKSWDSSWRPSCRSGSMPSMNSSGFPMESSATDASWGWGRSSSDGVRMKASSRWR